MNALLSILGLIALFAAMVLIVKRLKRWRELHDRRIRYERLSRFCIIPQKGTKPRY